MADGVFNIAKGAVNAYMDRVNDSDPTNAVLTIVLLKTVPDTDATLEDYDTLAALLAGGPNVEADFTNYARINLDDTDVTGSAVDDTNNWNASDIPDQTWSSAGGASNNTLLKMIICYEPDSTAPSDSNKIPLTHHDFSATTNGNDLTAQINATGFYKAA